MCHSCVSRNPGCFVPAAVGLVGKRELWDTFWIPACAGMTQKCLRCLGEKSCFIRLKCYVVSKVTTQTHLPGYFPNSKVCKELGYWPGGNCPK